LSDVLLLSMPYGAIERPSLGLSLLKAGLEKEGIEARVRYPLFDFAELIGLEVYQWVSTCLPHTALAGEWTFTEALYGSRPKVREYYEDRVLRHRWRRGDQDIKVINQISRAARLFIRRCLDEIDWNSYKIVGFTSTFEQNIPSLALARQLKRRYPHLHIVFGGANWEAVMGLELHRRFQFIDTVCSGEADVSFPRLARHLLEGDPADITEIPGIVYREQGESRSTGNAPRIFDMDSLPIPDYSDFYPRFFKDNVRDFTPLLLMESSRGCWWGARSHCTFCGLNGDGMAFRSKSPQRFFEEIDHLVDRWQIQTVEMTDNILDVKYFREVIPRLAERDNKLDLFYEVKANLSRAQIEIMSRAGITRIQPGIESLNDHTLKLMRKGITALQNIQMLKWCTALEIEVIWNVIYGFPGETPEDYREQIELIPAIHHLIPPRGTGSVRIDRFSPYFNDPDSFGIRDVEPIMPYYLLYPFSKESVARIAYFFEYSYEQAPEIWDLKIALIERVETWKNAAERGTLTQRIDEDDTLILEDSRNGRDETHRLDGLAKAAYLYCDENHTLKAISRQLAVDEESIRTVLDPLVDQQLMLRQDSRYLSLALSTTTSAHPEEKSAAAVV